MVLLWQLGKEIGIVLLVILKSLLVGRRKKRRVREKTETLKVFPR